MFNFIFFIEREKEIEKYKMKYIYANKCVFQDENKYISHIFYPFIYYHYIYVIF